MASKKGTYLSTKTGTRERYQSSYELRRMRALDKDPAVRHWTKAHGIRIPYWDGRRRRRYIPDFLVELRDGHLVVEETKGYIYQRLKFARKNMAAAVWCSMRGFKYRILYRDDLEADSYLIEEGSKNEKDHRKPRRKHRDDRRHRRRAR